MTETAPPPRDLRPREAPGYHSVQWRIMVRQLPLLLLLFIGLLYWLENHLRDTLNASHLESIRQSGLMVTNVIQTAMQSAEEHKIWEEVGQRIPVAEGVSYSIINPQGRVLFSTEPEEQGRVHSLTDAACTVCHARGSGTLGRAVTQTAFIQEPRGVSYKVFAAPLRNTKACRACHADRGPKLGMVYVRQSLAPVQRLIRTTQVGIIAAGAFAFVLTVLTTRILLGRYLGRPLKRLVVGARAIGAGDLEREISLSERSELSILANTLDGSRKKLRENLEELSRLHHERLRQERLAAIGETVAGLAHCLKNTLNGLRGGEYIVDSNLHKGDVGKLDQGWRILKNGIRHIESLSLDMLYYAGDHRLQREPIDPNQIVQEIADLLRDAAAGQGVRIHTELDEHVEKVPLDRLGIYRALLNLATNAVDACVDSETGDTVTMKSVLTPDELLLTVQDDGTGMSEQTREKIFERFFTTKPSKGTGLGLAVVKKIVEEHGGTMVVESALGQGSTFSLRLPRRVGQP